MEAMITKTRRARIAENKRKVVLARRRKVAGVTLGATVAAAAFFGTGIKGVTAEGGSYTVQRGDTLFRIAKEYRTTVDMLKKENNLRTDTIYVGQRLDVPTHFHAEDYEVPNLSTTPANASKNKYVVKAGDTLYRISQAYKVSVSDLKTGNGLSSDKILIGQTLDIPTKSDIPKEALEKANIYKVVPGDTLWSISTRFNIPMEKLKKQNGLKHDMVLIGQELIIKKKMVVTTAKVMGAADKFTVEFEANNELMTLRVAYGTAEDYQKLLGQDVIISYRNGALINLQK